MSVLKGGELSPGKDVLINTDLIADVAQDVAGSVYFDGDEKRTKFKSNAITLNQGKNGKIVYIFDDIDEIQRKWQEALDNDRSSVPVKKFNTSAAQPPTKLG